MEDNRSVTRKPKENRNGILDLAKAFLSIEYMNHKKLQKLCYYAKSWYLVLYDENLINEQFEAWIDGAVQPRLYQEYRSYGFSRIPMYIDYTNQSIPEEFLSFSKEIYNSYGKFSGEDLEKINHQEMPWINARKGIKPWQHSNNIILEEGIKSYYRKIIEI